LCTVASATTTALFSFSLKRYVYKCTKPLLAAKTSLIARAPVTNWEPRGVTLAGYYAVRYEMKVQLVIQYRVTHLQRYEVTLRGNVTSVYPPLKEKEQGRKVAKPRLVTVVSVETAKKFTYM